MKWKKKSHHVHAGSHVTHLHQSVHVGMNLMMKSMKMKKLKKKKSHHDLDVVHWAGAYFAHVTLDGQSGVTALAVTTGAAVGEA
jgi:hypothetical protein